MTCAYAVRGALKKVSGVDSVEVSLNKGLAVVKLKGGSVVQPQELWEVVRKNGFTPKETRVVVRGAIGISPQLELKVSGSNQVLKLTGDAKLVQEAAKHDAKTVIVEGSLKPGKDLKAAVPLELRSITPDR
jgi:copper chaperone CopZ